MAKLWRLWKEGQEYLTSLVDLIFLHCKFGYFSKLGLSGDKESMIFHSVLMESSFWLPQVGWQHPNFNFRTWGCLSVTHFETGPRPLGSPGLLLGTKILESFTYIHCCSSEEKYVYIWTIYGIAGEPILTNPLAKMMSSNQPQTLCRKELQESRSSLCCGSPMPPYEHQNIPKSQLARV